VRRRERAVSNHEASMLISGHIFETLALQAPQHEELDRSKAW
jgi:hypothetical protein